MTMTMAVPEDEGHYAFTITSATSMPSISFSSKVQIQTFDPECATLQDSHDSCEGVLIPDIRDLPGSPEVPTTNHSGPKIAVSAGDDENGISASLRAGLQPQK
jgi:hypothetical protein